MPTLFLMCGLPGAGKTTLAKSLEQEHNALRLCPDEWMARLGFDGHDEEKRKHIEILQWDLAQRALALNLNVILENGFWSRDERKQYRAKAEKLGAHVKLHFLDVPRDELWARLQKRNTDLPPDTFLIKESDLDLWLKQFERPREDELTL